MEAKTEALKELVNNPVSRRDFAARTMAGLAGAGALLAWEPTRVLANSAITDVDILNFALNLEYLEAEFYTVGVTGQRIQDLGIGVSGTGSAGATVGGGKVALDDRTLFISRHIALDEQQHVKFLRTALGSAAVAKPAINLDALGLGFSNQNEFLTVASIFEDVGVSAYAGAAPLIDSAAILGAAARIALTEGQHAGVLRLLAADNRLPIPKVDAKAIPTIGVENGRLFFVLGNGLSQVRTTSEVLSIVYAGGTSGGGFFPRGVNGTIDSV